MRKNPVVVTVCDDAGDAGTADCSCGQAVPEAAAVFGLRLPPAPSVEQVCDAVAASGMVPSDVRTSVVLCVGGGDPARAVAAYVGLVGYMRRRPDRLLVDGHPVDVAAIGAAARGLMRGALAEVGPAVQIGSAIPDAGVPLPTDRPWTDVEYMQLRQAVHARWSLPDTVVAALHQLALLAAVRAAPPKDRFPIAVTADGAELDLDAVRKACSDLRAASGQQDRSTLVAAQPASARATRLQQAADTDALLVLQRLGLTELVCPRSARHTRPADPLLVVAHGNVHRVECSVCDPDPVDALRLVMDTTGMVADDAAAWILGETPDQPAGDIGPAV